MRKHGADNIAVRRTQGIMRKARHVHDQSIIRASGAVIFSSPICHGELGVVEQVRIPGNDIFPRLANLPVLRVIQGTVDGSSGYGSAGEENAMGLLD